MGRNSNGPVFYKAHFCERTGERLAGRQVKIASLWPLQSAGASVRSGGHMTGEAAAGAERLECDPAVQLPG